MSEPHKDDVGPGRAESATPEAGTPEAGTEQAGTRQTETPEAGTPDAGTPDAGTPDAGTPDAGTPDAGTPDAGTPGAGTPEAGSQQAAVPASTASAPTPKTSAGNKGLLLGVGGLVVLIAVLALGAFVWPGFLAGPGKPDDTAASAAASLGSKNSAELDKLLCRGPDGKTVGQLSPEALQLIQAAKPAGPTTLVLDTQAQLPIDLTISAQGQTQEVPANLLFAVNDGKWCMAGLSMRQ